MLSFQILGFALPVIIGQVAVLTEALRIMGLVRVRTRPSLFGSAAAMVATHAHVLGVMAPRHMRAAHTILLVILEV